LNRPIVRSGVASMVVFGGFALLLFVAGLQAGGTTLMITAMLIALVAVAAVVRVDLAMAGLLATCGFVFVCSWTAWHIGGGLRPRLLFLLLALVLTLAAHFGGRFPHLPWWYLALIGSVVLLSVVDSVLPESQRYLDHRYIESQAGIWGPGLTTGISDFGTGLRFLVTLVGAALTISICSLHYRRAPIWIAMTYAAGASLSGLVAFSDAFLGTSLGHALTGIGFRGDRPTGFTDHPVIMAAANVYAIAIAAWLVTTSNTRQRIIGAALLPGLVLGTYASKSRGGTICLVLAILLCLVILPQYRRHLHFAAFGAAIAGGVLFVVFPSAGHGILVATRLAGGKTANSVSDTGRVAVLHQGLRDFAHSPIDGIGLHVMTEAHNVIVQCLAAGGLILLFGFLCVQFGGAWEAWRLSAVAPLAAPLLATVITGFVFGNLENTLTEPLVYVPVALIVALKAQQSAPQAEAPAIAERVAPPARDLVPARRRV
jgi:O-antigen ligase